MLIAAAALAYASFLDVKSRLVPDSVWLASFPPVAALLSLSILWGEVPPAMAAFSLGLTAAISATAYFAGLAGGADAIAFMLLGAALPSYPEGLPLLGDPLNQPAFAALCNSLISAAPIPIVNLALNLREAARGRDPLRGIKVRGAAERLLLALSARRVSLDELKKGLRYFPAERLVDGERVPLLFSRAEWDFTSLLSEMEARGSLYEDGVLAAPTLPLIVFLAVGLALTPLGNLIFIPAMRWRICVG
jgi:prepilin signal peptidase PulO-like enzyme (type II secretory pathway)